MYGLVQTTPPTTEPVSVPTLKQHLRLSVSSDDAMLAMYITTARMLIEEWTGRQMVQAGFTLYLDSWTQFTTLWGWNIGNMYSPMLLPNSYWWQRPLLLPKPPCISLTSVQYYDANNVLQTLAPSGYVLDTTREPARILLNQWPNLNSATVPRVVIAYQAGYTTVPTPLQHAVMLLASDFYRAREANTEMRLVDVPYGFRALINSYKIFDFDAYGSTQC